MTITFVSVIVALAVGGIEALGLISGKLSLDGPFWAMIGDLNDGLGVGGYGNRIGSILAVCWIVSHT